MQGCGDRLHFFLATEYCKGILVLVCLFDQPFDNARASPNPSIRSNTAHVFQVTSKPLFSFLILNHSTTSTFGHKEETAQFSSYFNSAKKPTDVMAGASPVWGTGI
jgi:hypothetical protein